jgi:hypothetical protein
MVVERSVEKSYPTNSISKADLIGVRPDLAATIEALADEQMQQLADRVGDILTDEYWSAVDHVLRRSFGEETEDIE